MRLLIFSITAGFAVPTGDPAEARIRRADDAIQTADSLFAAHEADSALALLDPLLSESREAGDQATELHVLLAQTRILNITGRPVPGETVASQGLILALHLADTLSICEALRWLSVSTMSNGRPAESISHARRLLALSVKRGDQDHEAYARLSLSYADLTAGRLLEAQENYREAIAIFQRTGNRRFELIARTGLGRCLYNLGRLEEAGACFAEVAEGSGAIGDVYSRAHALNNQGTIEFDLGDPAEAGRHFRQALDLQLAGGNLEGSIAPATNLAVAQTYLRRLDDAAATLMEASRICEEAGLREAGAGVLEQLAQVRKQQRRHPEAAALFRESASRGRTTSIEIHARSLIGLAETLWWMDSAAAGMALLEERVEPLRDSIARPTAVLLERMRGELLLRQQRPADALCCFREAEALAEPLGSFSRTAPLALSARCLAQLGERDSALERIHLAARFWEQERSRSRSPEWREQLGIDGRFLYTVLAEILLGSEGDVREKARVADAFDGMQRYKTRTLIERMRGGDPSPASGGESCGYEPVTLRQVQDIVLREDELLVDSFFGTDAVWLFFINRHECRAARLGLDPAVLEERIHTYLDLIVGGDPGEEGRSDASARFRARGRPGAADPDHEQFVLLASTHLCELLLGSNVDLVRSARRILFAPDGPLHLVPFGSLAMDDSHAGPVGATGGRKALIEDREILTVPSTTILAALRMRGALAKEAPATPRILALAESPDDSIAPLPGARAEIAWLEDRYSDVHAPLMNRAGRIGSTDIDLGDYRILHFAGHTRIDDVSPWRSAIPLAPGLSGVEDGMIRAETIATMRLHARLAVLSGCTTGGGRVLSGEGVFGLTSAFLASGVPAVVATLWPVSDRATTHLVEAFYRSLEKGSSVASAMREAQNTVRRDRRTRNPRYWAGFIVVGDGDLRLVLPRRASTWRAYIMLTAVGLAIAAVLSLARRQVSPRRAGVNRL